jgi:hypothetical protein
MDPGITSERNCKCLPRLQKCLLTPVHLNRNSRLDQEVQWQLENQ